jgi:hypothetical protein
MKLDRDIRAALVRTLAEAGIDEFRFSMGGRHPRLRFEIAGKSSVVILPSTPSDRRAVLNARAFVRRLVRGSR